MHSPEEILKEYWGFDNFRPLQKDIVDSVLSGKDTLALLPTGGGKSVCFQVPALAKDGICLVISPLIALMKDQVENLRKKNITAFAIYSGITRKEVINILKLAGESNCKFLYVSPERLETNLFKEYLPSLDINLIAVDEAHCISQWGYDFRPPYLRIAALREDLPDVPVLALTASATKEVQQDICDKLQFNKPAVFQQSFERPNLSYSSFRTESKINKIIDVLQKVNGCGIVYCKSRKRTKWFSDLLNMQSISADFYHAGLTQEERNRKQEAWIQNETRIIVCTNAFGMGIDKPDVRVVIHADVPDCLENYYQEAGRAGRDGKKSYAVLLYEPKELIELKELPEIRFPVIEKIRIVYQALMNYLQIPSGMGEGNSYDFDFTDFLKKFELDTQLVTYSLKTLEQEDLMSFNEQVFIPSKIRFITNKRTLYDFEALYPDLEPIIKILLRTYEGIFDQPVFIFEKNIAYLLKKDLSVIATELRQLHSYGIIAYAPQKDKPQLFFIQNRVKEEDLRINQENYRKRKKQFEARIEMMLAYTTDDKKCRSQVIATYFGDDNTKPCGICDNCLSKKNQSITKEEFEKIQQQILTALKPGAVKTKDLLKAMGTVKKEKLLKVLEFLQSENIINVNKDDEVIMTGSK